MFIRAITGIVVALAVLYSIFYLHTYYVAGFAGVVFLLGIFEWSNLMGFEKLSSKAINSIAFIGIAALIYFAIVFQYIKLFSFLYFALVWWLLAVVLTFIYPKSKQVLSIKFVSFIAGVLTILPACFSIIYILDSSVLGRGWLLFLLLVIWGADTGAYFVGKAFGSKKLSENISPGKTWEGVLGGFLTALLLTVALFAARLMFPKSASFIPECSLVKMLTLSFIITFFALIGDLQESIFKRIRGVKDSGNLLPGHGGILDRIDSLTAAAPMFLVAFAFLY